MHIVEAARMGADICTCPPAVIDALYNHPLTTIGLEKFLKDWEKAQAVKAVARDSLAMDSRRSPNSNAAPSSAAARDGCDASTTPAS